LISRRRFLEASGGAIAWAALSKGALTAKASPGGMPLGLQLYSVRDQLAKDYDGTLRQVAALGYQEVEAAGFYDRTAAQVKQSMTAARLHCISAHYPLAKLQPQLDEHIRYAKELGLTYMICSSPAPKEASSKASPESLTLDDWKWNAEQFNRIGERIKAAGMQFGYHNHVAEFHPQSGELPYDVLLKMTDPDKVTMEMDCGWVAVAGQSPAGYLERYPQRFSLLHVKDFKLSPGNVDRKSAVSTELGKGSLDYRGIFAAVKKTRVQHYFVEQEEFDMPPFEALKVDADYMNNLTV
jgi:sugar phosphate isomerase/epimerase